MILVIVFFIRGLKLNNSYLNFKKNNKKDSKDIEI